MSNRPPVRRSKRFQVPTSEQQFVLIPASNNEVTTISDITIIDSEEEDIAMDDIEEATISSDAVVVINDIQQEGAAAMKSPVGNLKLSECASQTTPGLEKNGKDTSDKSHKKTMNDSVDEEQSCPICFDMWTNSGPHRIVSLTCGHLFGRSCIERWLKDPKNKCCPHCKEPAKKKDIRNIFVKSLKALDTTEKEQVKKQLLEEKFKRSKAEENEAKALLKYQLLKAEMEQLRKEVENQQQQTSSLREPLPGSLSTQSTFISQQPSTPSSTNTQASILPDIKSLGKSYVFQRELQVSQKGARVMSFDKSHMTLVVSKPSPNQLFKGYGVLKVSSIEARSSKFIRIHQGVIRDAKFNTAGDQLLLTGSIDKSLKLTSILSDATVQSYSCPSPVWSCAWNEQNTNIVFAGLQNGSIQIYDIRQTNGELFTIRPRVGVACPIVSLAYVPPGNENSLLRCEGVIVGTINGGWFLESAADQTFNAHQLILPEGACSGLHFNETTRHCLLSVRPGKRCSRMIHNICQLAGDCSLDHPIHANVVQRCFGGNRAQSLNRSSLLTCPDMPSAMMVASGDEASSSLMIWDGHTGKEFQRITTSGGVVFDTLAFEAFGSYFLASLTEQKLSFYQWQ